MSSLGQLGQFKSYVKQFDDAYYVHKGGRLPIKQLQLKFTNTMPPNAPSAVGVCYTQTKVMKVLKSFWDRASSFQKKALIFHELGHCYLKLGHNSGKSNGHPESIMYPSVIPAYSFSMYESEYIEELFTGNEINFRPGSVASSSEFDHIKCAHIHE